eukprot:Skav221034  [mRNA]  locus=scaffold1448:125083:125316:+ [translate_table: standard]
MDSSRQSRELREKLENLQLKHPPHEQRVAVNSLSDGMMRLDQEDRIMIKEKVNMAQENGPSAGCASFRPQLISQDFS